MRTIIPCAGFGTRMNLPPNQSKELLIDPKTNEPLIKWTLDLSIDPLIILRKEKEDLIQYCKDNQIEYIITEPTKEWPETILRSEDRWDNTNVLLLPDTRFGSHYLNVMKVRQALQFGCKKLVFGVHKVDDLSKWGEVSLGKTREKPQHLWKVSGYAWGVLGFSKDIGNSLFNAYLDKTPFNYEINDVEYVDLSWFTDLTRNGKIEDY